MYDHLREIGYFVNIHPAGTILRVTFEEWRKAPPEDRVLSYRDGFADFPVNEPVVDYKEKDWSYWIRVDTPRPKR